MNYEEKILQMFEKIQSDIDGIKTDINEIKTDIDGVKSEMNSKFNKMDSRFDKMDSRFDKIEADIDLIKIQQNEHGQFLSSIISRADIHNAELDRLNIEAAKISGSVKSVETKVDFLTDDLNTVEHITVKNYSDILRLKTK